MDKMDLLKTDLVNAIGQMESVLTPGETSWYTKKRGGLSMSQSAIKAPKADKITTKLRRTTLFQAAALICLLFPVTIQAQAERIKKGDLLEISVYGHPELSKTVMVQQSGNVDYPLVANIPIDGMRLEEFQSVVSTQVARYLGERPIVTVWFSQTLNIVVTVLGQVNQPGQYPISKQATLQGAITRAGGFTPRAELDNVQILRKNSLGEARRDTVDLTKFFLGGDLAQLPELENGDVILVPGMPGSYDVKVLGAVRLPGGYPVQFKTSLLDVLFMAGGPIEKADLRRVRVSSATRSRTLQYSLEPGDLFEGKRKGKEIPDVLPGDVVYVPLKGKSFFGIVRDLVTFASPLVMILYYTGVIDIRR